MPGKDHWRRWGQVFLSLLRPALLLAAAAAGLTLLTLAVQHHWEAGQVARALETAGFLTLLLAGGAGISGLGRGVGTIPAGLASRRLDRPLQTHPNDLLAGTRRESTERGRAFGCMLQGVFACLLLIAAAEIVRLLAR